MKRILIVAAAVLAMPLLGAVALAASQPRASLHSFSCQHAVRPLSRGISVWAVMRPLKGTQRMELKFDLLSKPRGRGSYSIVNGGDLGAWISPSKPPTLGQRPSDVWRVFKSVVDLAAPAAYRFRVSFRWIGPRQHVLGAMTRESPVCSQPELRPDLVVQSIDVQAIPQKPSLNRYVARIRNDGASAAGSFRVQFAPGGALQPKYRTIPDLAAHSARTVTFVGPACNGTAASTITADPDGVVDDFDRANNTMTAVCPTPAALR